jgi:hypothetical protein
VSLAVEAIEVLSAIPVRPECRGVTLGAEEVIGSLESHLTPGGGGLEVTLTSRLVGILAIGATVIEEHGMDPPTFSLGLPKTVGVTWWNPLPILTPCELVKNL